MSRKAFLIIAENSQKSRENNLCPMGAHVLLGLRVVNRISNKQHLEFLQSAPFIVLHTSQAAPARTSAGLYHPAP